MVIWKMQIFQGNTSDSDHDLSDDVIAKIRVNQVNHSQKYFLIRVYILAIFDPLCVSRAVLPFVEL